MDKPNRKYFVWHVLGAIVFLALPTVLSPHPPGDPNFLLSKPTQRDFIANIFMLFFFYLNYYYLIPKLYFNKKHLVYGLSIAAAFLVIMFLPSILTGYMPWAINPPPPHGFEGHRPRFQITDYNFLPTISHNILLFTSVVLLSILISIRNRLLNAEKERHTAELDSLKAQINPHFLFNTLNSIYALAVKDKSNATANTLLKLSGLMRYMFTDAGNEFVTLDKEIGSINDYIELQKLRLDKKVLLEYKVTGSTTNKQIAPLTLMPFIENAFKHGVNPDEDSHINIQIKIEDNHLTLTVENNKVNVQLDPHEIGGIGIENTKSRLRLLYPSQHNLLLSEDEKHYSVQLTVYFT